MNWLQRLLALLGIAKSGEPQIVRNALSGADNAARELSRLGYRADFSFESLRDIERFMEEHSAEGEARAGGELVEGAGAKLFAIGCYVGEVIRRDRGGTWVGSDSDPERELSIAVELPETTDSVSTIWPVQKMVERFNNGDEDNIWHYANIVTGKVST